MTVRQAVEYIDARGMEREDRFKEQAVLLSGQAQQIGSMIHCMLDRHGRFLGLEKLYPALFGKKTQSELEPAELRDAQIRAWHDFLGI